MSMMDLPADLSGNHAAALLPLLQRQVQAAAAAQVTLNAGGVQRFDSATLALLLECRRQVQSQGGSLRMVQLPAGLQSMATAYGVDGLLGIALVSAVSA